MNGIGAKAKCPPGTRCSCPRKGRRRPRPTRCRRPSSRPCRRGARSTIESSAETRSPGRRPLRVCGGHQALERAHAGFGCGRKDIAHHERPGTGSRQGESCGGNAKAIRKAAKQDPRQRRRRRSSNAAKARPRNRRRQTRQTAGEDGRGGAVTRQPTLSALTRRRTANAPKQNRRRIARRLFFVRREIPADPLAGRLTSSWRLFLGRLLLGRLLRGLPLRGGLLLLGAFFWSSSSAAFFLAFFAAFACGLLGGLLLRGLLRGLLLGAAFFLRFFAAFFLAPPSSSAPSSSSLSSSSPSWAPGRQPPASSTSCQPFRFSCLSCCDCYGASTSRKRRRFCRSVSQSAATT